MKTVPSRFPLIQLPTPLHRLNRLSDQLGLDLWIKRDDLTGFALGGNKGRKVEYLVAAALAEGAQTVVTCGALQSNFVRTLGAACKVAGIRCHAAVMNLPYEEEAVADFRGLMTVSGNVLLDQVFGVKLHLFPDGSWEELYRHAESLAVDLEHVGSKVYRIPVGGSSVLGCYSFYDAGLEISNQGPPFDSIVFASSSGSTHTGLGTYFHGSSTSVIGIACDPEPELTEDFSKMSHSLSEFLQLEKKLRPQDFRLELDYVGEGYGIPSPDGKAAIRCLAEAEGILLDPIYSGKAFAGLLDLAEKGALSGRVLFWHTGGVPALFALKNDYFLEESGT